jgi:hypothetical protein
VSFSLNILTLPDPKNRKGFLSKQLYLLKNFLTKSHLGHPAVTKSLIRGLKLKKFFHNFNNYNQINYDICWVLSGVDTLKYALDTRDNYKFLVVGPNVVNMPNDENNILINKKIDLILVPSKWIKCAYEDFINKKKIICWYSGVNEKFFNSKATKKVTRKVLVYSKTPNHNLLKKIKILLNKNNLEMILIKYGAYTQANFKKALSTVDFAIFISQSESQGIALAESWSMNVPTFVWQKKILKINNVNYKYTSAAPYLSAKTGNFFNNIQQLNKIVKDYYKNRLKLVPRKWILKNMTDKISAKNILNILNNLSKDKRNYDKK